MDSSSLLVVIVGIAGILGATMLFIGYLAAMATAFGNKHWGWGIGMIFLGPLAALPYSVVHGDVAAWPRGLQFKGLVIAVVALLAAYYLLPLGESLLAPKRQDIPPTGAGQPPATLPAGSAPTIRPPDAPRR
jgi:hypothetical protein